MHRLSKAVHLLAASVLAAGSSTLAPLPASAQPYSLVINGTPVIASAFRPGHCIDIRAGGNDALLWQCHGAGNQEFRFAQGTYGAIRVQGRCLSTSGGEGASLVAAACSNVPAQRWAFTPAGQLRNEQGWCADVERGGGHGSRVIAYRCGTQANQQWMHARFKFGQLETPPSDLRNAIAAKCSANPGSCVPVQDPMRECIRKSPPCFVFLPTQGARQFRAQ